MAYYKKAKRTKGFIVRSPLGGMRRQIFGNNKYNFGDPYIYSTLHGALKAIRKRDKMIPGWRSKLNIWIETIHGERVMDA